MESNVIHLHNARRAREISLQLETCGCGLHTRVPIKYARKVAGVSIVLSLLCAALAIVADHYDQRKNHYKHAYVRLLSQPAVHAIIDPKFADATRLPLIAVS